MNTKSFLFVSAWMKPLKALPAEQRWNVMEAIAEYATIGQMTKQLDPMETLAFLFIRNEIDRMNCYRAERSERRRSAAQKPQEKDPEPIDEALSEDANGAKDANACKPIQEDAPLYIISESVSVSESKSVSESNKKSSSTRVRVRERNSATKQNQDRRTKAQILSTRYVGKRHEPFSSNSEAIINNLSQFAPNENELHLKDSLPARRRLPMQENPHVRPRCHQHTYIKSQKHCYF